MRQTLLSRRRALAATLLAAALPVVAQTYPSKPIRIIVPYAAGGSTDQLARAVQQPLADALGQPVVIDNRPGAGGAIGTDMVAKAAPDGYTLVFGNSGPSALLSLMRKTPYDEVRDFRPISTVAFTPMILAVPAELPVANVQEFVAYVKKQGGNLNIGSVGNGSFSHLTSEYFNTAAGVRLQHVPYNGGAPLTTAMLGGQVQACFVTGLDGATMLATGKVKYLGVATLKPTPVVPGQPAIADALPGFRSAAWFGLLAPRGTHEDVVQKLNAAVVAAVARPDIQKLFTGRNVEARSSTPAEMETLIKDEIQQWKPVIQGARIEM